MSCEEGEMRRRRRRSPLDVDDLLSEILLRLPPLPSSLPRASAVCKRWRGLASDPAFSRRFRRHHRRSAPLLGLFHRDAHGLSFLPTPEVPNRVPPGRFSLQLDNYSFYGCRHGLVLIFDRKSLQFLVWDPVTGQQTMLAIPPGFESNKANVHGAVLSSAAAAGDFKVVLVAKDTNFSRRILARVYSSEARVWGDLISAPIPSWDFLEVASMPAVLVGDSPYWKLAGMPPNILEFDLERGSLSVIPIPVDLHTSFTVMRAQGGGLSLLCLSGFTAKLWKMNTDSDGNGSWGMGTTIQLDNLLSLDSDSDKCPEVEAFAEDNNLVLLWSGDTLFTLQLDSLQFKRLLPKPERRFHYRAFESVYAAGI